MPVTRSKSFGVQYPPEYDAKYLNPWLKWFKFCFPVFSGFVSGRDFDHVVAFPGELDKHLRGKRHVVFFQLHVIDGFMGDCAETRLAVAEELAVEEIISWSYDFVA